MAVQLPLAGYIHRAHLVASKLPAAFIAALLYLTVPHRQQLGHQPRICVETCSRERCCFRQTELPPTAPIQRQSGTVSTRTEHPPGAAVVGTATDRVDPGGHGHYYGVAPLLDRWLLAGSQARLSAPARNASRAVLLPERVLLVDAPARTVVGSWTPPTLPARPGRADDGTLAADWRRPTSSVRRPAQRERRRR